MAGWAFQVVAAIEIAGLIATRSGVPIMLDPAPAAALPDSLLKMVRVAYLPAPDLAVKVGAPLAPDLRA